VPVDYRAVARVAAESRTVLDRIREWGFVGGGMLTLLGAAVVVEGQDSDTLTFVGALMLFVGIAWLWLGHD
jgi:hypothetical protein